MSDRDCEHGYLARSCPYCERDEALARVKQLEAERDAHVKRAKRLANSVIPKLRGRAERAETRAAELEAGLKAIADDHFMDPMARSAAREALVRADLEPREEP